MMTQDLLALLQTARDTQWPYADVKARFEAEAAVDYGEGMARWVPDYEYAHGLLLQALRLSLPAGGRVLDLGAGTGRFSKMILETFSDCSVTLVDFSDNMLKEAPHKLAAFSGRYELRSGDFFDEAVDFPLGVFDGVVSVFAICHGRGINLYQHLYQKIYHWLKPSGYFLCYDHVLGDSDPFTVLNMVGWQKFMALNQPAAQVYEGLLSTYQEDAPLSLRKHLALLTEAGFGAVDVLWKKDIFAIYAGVKT